MGETGLPQSQNPTQTAGVIVGIRPEALTRSDPGARAPAPAFEARVDLVEWLGAELFVHLDAGPQPLPIPPALERLPFGPRGDRTRLIARLDPAARVAEGDRLRLAVAVAAQDLHRFDGETGVRLDNSRKREA